MTITETQDILILLSAQYPNMMIGDEKRQSALESLWQAALASYSYDIVKVAVIEVIKSCKFEPKIADIVEQIKLMHKALFPTAEEIWHEYEMWAKRDYMVAEQYVRKSECGQAGITHDGKTYCRCNKYDICDHKGNWQGKQASDDDCDRIYETIPAHFDHDLYKADFVSLPSVVRDYFFGDIADAQNLRKKEATSYEIAKNRFIKFYDRAIAKTEIQRNVPQRIIDKIESMQTLQLEQTAKSMMDK